MCVVLSCPNVFFDSLIGFKAYEKRETFER